MKKFKSVCINCGRVEHYTLKERILGPLISIFFYIGLLTVLFLLIVGPVNFHNGVFTSIGFKMAGSSSNFDARGYALNHTSFDGDDSFLFAEELVTNIPHIRYVKNDIVPSYEIILEQGSDCKGMSVFFTKLMQSVGYSATMDCAQGHCVSKVYYSGMDSFYDGYYMIVDLTGDMYAVYEPGSDHWSGDIPYSYNYLTKTKSI